MDLQGCRVVWSCDNVNRDERYVGGVGSRGKAEVAGYIFQLHWGNGEQSTAHSSTYYHSSALVTTSTSSHPLALAQLCDIRW
jgi:hypothetical protein